VCSLFHNFFKCCNSELRQVWMSRHVQLCNFANSFQTVISPILKKRC
jgi:hypothetical protein